MKRWLAILALALWAATALQAAEERLDPAPQVRVSISILTQDDRSDDPASAPMVATAVATGPFQLCSTGHYSGKETKTPGGESSLHGGANPRCGRFDAPGLEAAAEAVCLPDNRTRGRYIYFLRRIII